MDELLFLAHRIPYPPNKGDKIRSWNILKALADQYSVHLGCFIDDPEDNRHRATLEGICRSCRFVPLSPGMAKLRSLTRLGRGSPLTLGYFYDSGLARWCRDLLNERPVDRVFAFSSSMAQYAFYEAPRPVRRIVDFVDVDSDKWRQYGEARNGLAGLVYRRESRTLLSFERRVAEAADAGLFVSEAEADLFRRLAPESAHKIMALENGVDLSYFDPELRFDNPFANAGPCLVFTGAMDYWANVDAVLWFARTVFPAIRARRPDAEFWIIGAKPTADVTRLGRAEGVTVTGQVDDVRPYIAHATAVVAPLRLARGVQNKVLEAMALAKPVIGTPEAVEGIDAQPGREFYCESDAGRFAERAIAVIADASRDEIGVRARKCVEARYGWRATLSSLKTILEVPAIN